MTTTRMTPFKTKNWLRACGLHFQVNTVRLVACSLQLVAFFTVSCVAQRTGKTYSEDLSAYRPVVETRVDTSKKMKATAVARPSIKPTKNVNAKVDAVLDSIDKQNLQKKFVEGFTIQIYSGQSREEANVTKQRVAEELTDVVANLLYSQPKFRVTVGDYFSKLEAQKDLMRLKSYFPGAILVPEKIQIR